MRIDLISPMQYFLQDIYEKLGFKLSRDERDRYSDGSYLRNNPSWHSEDAVWKANQVTLMLTRNKVSLSTVADFGCGTGDVAIALASRFPHSTFTGYEISHDAATQWPKTPPKNLTFKMGMGDATQKYSVGLCLDVFEHVDDYMGFLREIRPLATTFIFHIPLDLSASALIRGKLESVREEVGHLHHFTKESALSTLIDCGYQIQDWNYTAAYSDLPPKNTQENLARLPRKIIFALSKKWAQRILGGSSLMVLTRPN